MEGRIMQRSERAMRLVILSHLFEHLRKVYRLEWPRKVFRNGQISDGELDALFAFRADPKLESLGGALVRLRDRTFGFCLNCKKEIVQQLLDLDPSRRLCSGCEAQLNHPHHTRLITPSSWGRRKERGARKKESRPRKQ